MRRTKTNEPDGSGACSPRPSSLSRTPDELVLLTALTISGFNVKAVVGGVAVKVPHWCISPVGRWGWDPLLIATKGRLRYLRHYSGVRTRQAKNSFPSLWLYKPRRIKNAFELFSLILASDTVFLRHCSKYWRMSSRGQKTFTSLRANIALCSRTGKPGELHCTLIILKS